MYGPYDFKTTEEREGGKFRGTIVFTGIDEKLRGSWEDLGTYGGLAVCSCGDPQYTDSHVFLPGRYTEHDHSPITITDEPTFRRVVSALNAVRDKLIAEHEAKEKKGTETSIFYATDWARWPCGNQRIISTKDWEDSMESITVDGWTVKLLKPITLAGIIKCGNVECKEFKKEYNDFEEAVCDDRDELTMFDTIVIDEQDIKTILAHPKWRDFLVQHGFIEVKKVEPEFHVQKGDVFTVRGLAIVCMLDSRHARLLDLNYISGNHYGSATEVQDPANITCDEFIAMLGSHKDRWQSIYATKCRITKIETEKA